MAIALMAPRTDGGKKSLKDAVLSTSGNGQMIIVPNSDNYMRCTLYITATKNSDNEIIVTARTGISDRDGTYYSSYSRTATCKITI